MHNTKHYGSGEYEPIKVIDAYDLNFSLGNAIKYILRAGKKDEESKIKDLMKAHDYILHEIHKEEKKDEEGVH